MTTPGPTLIYECPGCKGHFSRRTIGSGNTFGARIRSDGRLFAPMLPTTPPLVACPHCNAVVQIFIQNPIAQFRTYFSRSSFLKINGEEQSSHDTDEEMQEQKLAELYGNTPMYLRANAGHYFDLLESDEFDKTAELALRKNALWACNDEIYRSTIPQGFRARLYLDPEVTSNNDFEHHARAHKNLQLLFESLGEIDEDELVLKAELLRELGLFKQACELLDRELNNGTAAEQIIRRAEAKDSRPFLLADKDDQYEWEYAWNARRYEPEKIATPFEEITPPLFKISNRDWYVKVLGMLSHNWALIEEHKDNTATVYFFQDHADGERPAIIDSLDFEDALEAWDALTRNGFDFLKNNPGPWMGCEPKGYFYDARTTESAIYSNGKYWI